MHSYTILQEKEAAKIFDEVGQRPPERLFPGFKDSSEQATLSANQSSIGYDRAQDVARPAHLGVIAAQPRILDMIRGAATARLLPEQPLSARLHTTVSEAATAAFLDALDNPEKRTPRITCKKQPKLQMIHGSKQYRDTTAQPSRTQQCQKSTRVASPPSTMTTTPSPHFAPC